MIPDSVIGQQIDELRARFPETQALYREVCTLLFFRHGITPTTNKLYQLVRKGSMSAPAEALSRFWTDLRARSKVDIDHPDLPDEIKSIAAEAIHKVWGAASGRARAELEVCRQEAVAALGTCREELDQARAEAAIATETIGRLREDFAAREAELHASEARCSQEGARASAAESRADELRLQVHALQQALAQAQAQFTAEMANGRATMDAAQARFDAADRRALLEIDHERQARARTDKALAALRQQAMAAASAAQVAAQEQSTLMSAVGDRLATAEAACTRLENEVRRRDARLEHLQGTLLEAQRTLVQRDAEVQTLRGVVRTFKPRRPGRATAPR